MARACERLVLPTLNDANERAYQGRLIGLLLGLPFFAGTLAAQLLYGAVPTGTMLSWVCLIFGIAWSGAVVVAVTGRAGIVEKAGLALTTVGVGTAVAAGGLLQSPLLVLLLAAPFEIWWLHRSRALSRGWWASAAACALAFVATAGSFVVQQPFAFADHLWVVPLCYAASMWLRVTGGSVDSAPAMPARYDDLAALTGTLVARIDENNEIDLMTGPSRELFGVPAPVLLGTGLFERLHVTDRVEFLAAIAEVRETGNRIEHELRVRTASDAGEQPTGPYEHRQFAFAPDPEFDGGVLIMASASDKLEALRRELKEVRAEADSIEVAKSRFLASVSHELRTPLNAIIGFADMLDNEMFGPFSDSRQKEYVGLIGESGQHLLSVVNAILDVSKIESGNYTIEPEPFEFREALEMCHSMMVLQARSKKIGLTRTIDRAVGEICADRRAVQQILINLVSNAIKFTPEGGEIDVSADIAGSDLRIRVRDNGIGMSAADLDRIGRPFMQVNNAYTRQYDGTGLGLSLVKGLVGLHNGSMEIDSAPDHGTTVTIRLPVAGLDSAVHDAAEIAIEAETEELDETAQRKQA